MIRMILKIKEVEIENFIPMILEELD